MANVDRAFGFKPVGRAGSPYNGGTIKCAILAADSTDTFIGDLVTLSGTSSAEGYPSVAQSAAAGTAHFGVIVSFDPLESNLETKYRVASTLRYCNVVPATQDQWFEIQASGAFAITDVGDVADITIGSGNTTSGVSTMELLTPGTNQNLHIMGVVNAPDNEVGANARLLVRVNENAFGGDGTAA